MAGRDLDLAGLDEPRLLMLAVPDPHVAELAARLPAQPPPGSAVVHTAGGLTLAALETARSAGWEVGAFHPLRPFPAPQPPSAFWGITIAVDASTPALLTALEELARHLRAVPRRVTDGQRALYHAAAVTGSNYLVALAGEAAGMLEQAGWSREDALAALSPLLRSTFDGIEGEGLPGALTGPIRRGDAEAVRRHLAALEGGPHARVYRILGLAALRMALEAGLDEAAAKRIEEALTG